MTKSGPKYKTRHGAGNRPVLLRLSPQALKKLEAYSERAFMSKSQFIEKMLMTDLPE